ncbi:MAG: GNAT family N-acetyltransferase [Gemmatimonadetes bacterium]|nr:GNAT family N-acetyltransferase [Gemmatimonadota bacterium]
MTRNADPRVATRPATAADLPEILALLSGAGLPGHGVDSLIGTFRVASDAARVIGVAGLEPCGTDALLRSVVVHADARGRGTAGRLCADLERDAARRGIRRLYLLTETAEAYFARRGFHATEREAVPPGIADTAEFRTLCPDTAVVMVKSLSEGSP